MKPPTRVTADRPGSICCGFSPCRVSKGIGQIAARAEDVGVQIRLTIERIGGTMPEDFPRYRLISRGEWVPEDQLSLLDWDSPSEETNTEDPPILIIQPEEPN